MPEGIGYGAAQAFQPTLATPRVEQVAEQTREITVSQSQTAAENVQRQADFSSSRAESLGRQAELLEDRAETRSTQPGLGATIDISA